MQLGPRVISVLPGSSSGTSPNPGPGVNGPGPGRTIEEMDLKDPSVGSKDSRKPAEVTNTGRVIIGTANGGSYHGGQLPRDDGSGNGDGAGSGSEDGSGKVDALNTEGEPPEQRGFAQRAEKADVLRTADAYTAGLKEPAETQRPGNQPHEQQTGNQQQNGAQPAGNWWSGDQQAGSQQQGGTGGRRPPMLVRAGARNILSP